MEKSKGSQARYIIDAEHWSCMMGKDLERSDLQPLQPVGITRKGALKVSVQTRDALGFSVGDRVEIVLQKGHCVLRKQEQRGVAFKPGRPLSLTLSEEVAEKLCPPGAAGAVIVDEKGEARIFPLRLQEHPPDPLGPRFVDELREDCVVRHGIPGLPRDGWTREALSDLEEILCSEPFRVDPVSVIAEGEDWVGWMTRNDILKKPASGDEQLRERLAEDIYRKQEMDGSWDHVTATAHALLNLLELGEDAKDERLRKAAKWLLDLPEPPHRPGMWMLSEEYLEEWLSKRRPKEGLAFCPGEIQWTGPGERISFYSWEYPKSEQDQFRGQEMQRVIPTCARFHPPACEPRLTHVSAVVAEALIRCGYSDHPRVRRYVNTVFHVGGAWGYWCGCGALGLYDSDIPASENTPDFDVRSSSKDGASDMSPWRWVGKSSECALLTNQPSLPGRNPTLGGRGTHLEPFSWYRVLGKDNIFVLLGMAWQNGDCWVKTNRALSGHPSCRGSLMEDLAVYQASRYQNSLGEWGQAFPAGMLAFLSLYEDPVAKSLVVKTVPWLREHQAEDGLWHHEEFPREELAAPCEPRLATYHIVNALHKFGVLDRLRP